MNATDRPQTVREIIAKDDKAEREANCKADAWASCCAEAQTVLENAGFVNVDVTPDFDWRGRLRILATMEPKAQTPKMKGKS